MLLTKLKYLLKSSLPSYVITIRVVNGVSKIGIQLKMPDNSYYFIFPDTNDKVLSLHMLERPEWCLTVEMPYSELDIEQFLIDNNDRILAYANHFLLWGENSEHVWFRW